ncbi:MAG: hypothetical protein KGS47_07250 [Chloroflexi bacterium]|nr:hypothetical protein [Chloroflexota bacterium]
MKRIRLILRMISVVVVVLAGVGPAYAQVPDRTTAFVYGVNAANGTTYVGSFAPPTVRTIHVLANRVNIISPRRTEIYYWPITNEYKASWELMNEPVAGTLEVLANGQVITSSETVSYTIHYRPRGTEENATVYLGEEAQQRHAEFTQRQIDFRNAQAQYLTDQQQWIEATNDAGRRREAGENVPLPIQPTPPTPLNMYSNGINSGVPIDLPAGTYQLRLRQPDGSILADSERTLEVFDQRRITLGYTVMPEARWTTPEQIDDEHDVIVGRPNSRLYLVPRYAREFAARSLTLLENPQRDIGENAEWTWVAETPRTAGSLALRRASGTTAVPLAEYRVVQTQGSTLGYTVQPYDEERRARGLPPDIIGFPVSLERAGDQYRIEMFDEAGQPITTSARLVRVSSNPSVWSLLAVSLIPVIIGAIVMIRRHRRTRLPRNVAG